MFNQIFNTVEENTLLLSLTVVDVEAVFPFIATM
jgi:hypothetical protein